MTPYFSRDGIDIYCCDCRDFLPSLAVGAVDAVVTDPPYGLKSHNMRRAASMMNVDWDESPIDAETLSVAMSKAAHAIVWGGNYFHLPPTRCFLVWDKMNDGRSFADCEFAWTDIDAVARIFKMRPQDMDGGKIHPTQKPIALMEWCLGFLPESSMILDPFGGSMTTGVAAWNLGRQCILCEISEEYCELGAKRLDRLISQGRLFRPEPVKETQRSMFGDDSP